MSWFYHALIASLLLRPRMRLILFHQLRINLHRAYISMPEHFPDRMYIRAVFQKVRGEGMAESVGSDILFNPRHFLIMLYDFPEALTGHMFAADVDEEGLLVWVQDHLRSYQRDIITEGFDGGRIHWDEAFRITVYTPYLARLQVNIRDLQIDQLRHADPRRVKKLQHCLSAVAIRVDAVWLGKEQLHFPVCQDRRQLLGCLLWSQPLRWVKRDELLYEEMRIETFNRGNGPGNGGHGFAGGAERRYVAAQLLCGRINDPVFVEIIYKLPYISHI